MLISDNLFRAKNTLTRKTYVELAETSEKKYGVNTVIIGTMSPAGERLKLMTGVAAILRFPLPGIDEISEDDQDDEDDESNKDPFHISESNGSNMGGFSNHEGSSHQELSEISDSFDQQCIDDLIDSDASDDDD